MFIVFECGFLLLAFFVVNLTSLELFRWHNRLNPDIKKDAWTLEEELALMNAHREYGNKWAEIAKVLPGRYISRAILYSQLCGIYEILYL